MIPPRPFAWTNLGASPLPVTTTNRETLPGPSRLGHHQDNDGCRGLRTTKEQSGVPHYQGWTGLSTTTGHYYSLVAPRHYSGCLTTTCHLPRTGGLTSGPSRLGHHTPAGSGVGRHGLAATTTRNRAAVCGLLPGVTGHLHHFWPQLQLGCPPPLLWLPHHHEAHTTNRGPHFRAVTAWPPSLPGTVPWSADCEGISELPPAGAALVVTVPDYAYRLKLLGVGTLYWIVYDPMLLWSSPDWYCRSTLASGGELLLVFVNYLGGSPKDTGCSRIPHVVKDMGPLTDISAVFQDH